MISAKEIVLKNQSGDVILEQLIEMTIPRWPGVINYKNRVYVYRGQYDDIGCYEESMAVYLSSNN